MARETYHVQQESGSSMLLEADRVEFLPDGMLIFYDEATPAVTQEIHTPDLHRPVRTEVLQPGELRLVWAWAAGSWCSVRPVNTQERRVWRDAAGRRQLRPCGLTPWDWPRGQRLPKCTLPDDHEELHSWQLWPRPGDTSEEVDPDPTP